MEGKNLLYNEAEISALKEHFADNDALLMTIRKLLFGFELSKEEVKRVKDVFSKEGMIGLVQRKIYGELSPEGNLESSSDFWLGAESQIFGASRDTIEQTVISKQKVKEMFDKGMEALKNPEKANINLDYSVESLKEDPLQTGLIARNLYIKSITTALYTIKIIAGQKGETLEQTMKRIQKDSAK